MVALQKSTGASQGQILRYSVAKLFLDHLNASAGMVLSKAEEYGDDPKFRSALAGVEEAMRRLKELIELFGRKPESVTVEDYYKLASFLEVVRSNAGMLPAQTPGPEQEDTDDPDGEEEESPTRNQPRKCWGVGGKHGRRPETSRSAPYSPRRFDSNIPGGWRTTGNRYASAPWEDSGQRAGL